MNIHSVIAAAGLALAAFVSQSSIAAVTDVGLRIDQNGHIRVPVAVGDEGTFDFILDTAASRTGVMRPLVDELGWQPLEGEGAVLNGSSGQVRIDLFQPVEFRIGESVAFQPDILPGLNQLHIPNEPFYGILGSNFFEAYTIEIDAPSERLRFSEEGAGALLEDARDRFASADLTEVIDGIWGLEVMIGDVSVMALLDTGARGTMMNRAAAEALGINLPPEPSAESTEGEAISGASGHTMRGIGLQLSSISVGDRVWENATVLVSDLHVFDILGLSDQPAMMLASDLLFEGRLIVDYAAGRVFIENPQP